MPARHVNLLLIATWTGLVAGAAHVVAGADHLGALLPLAIGRRRRGFGLGARWGLGHGAGVLAVGGLALVLRERLNLHLVGAWGERAVGVMLLALGLLGLRRALRLEIHTHSHAHDGEPHLHLHLHPDGEGTHDRPHQLAPHRHRHAAFLAGTLHGIAGTAHVLGVLPALALPGMAAPAAYLAGFGIGTILAMGSFAATIGAIGAGGSVRSMRRALCTASALTVAVGVAWLTLPALGYGLP